MKSKLLLLVFALFILGCSNSVEFTEEYKNETSGKYLYHPDEIMTVSYDGNKIFFNFKGGKIEPVVLNENEFFIPDMYKKFRFVEHPETKVMYLSVISKDDETKISYDYKKLSDDYKTPSQYLKEGNYEKALAGYLEIKAQDSTSSYIEEWEFNRIGYRHLRDKDYQKAIDVFTLNTKLHPNSDNVYDSLADAYLQSGDSLQAYNNYRKALERNPNNFRAEKYLKAYLSEENK